MVNQSMILLLFFCEGLHSLKPSQNLTGLCTYVYIYVCVCIYMYIHKEAIPKENQSSQLTPPVVTGKAWRWEDVNKPHIPQETMGISM